MIITKINGGLGNQLFQYALGRSLAEHFMCELKLDLTSYETYKLRSYILNRFNIQENIATKEEIGRYIDNSILGRSLRKITPLNKRRYFHEVGFAFDKKIFETSGDLYVEGFWQSEKYFTSIRPKLLEEIVPKEDLSGENKLLARQIETSQSVSIHIRRGDYVSDIGTNKIHGICTLDYYYSAIEIISNRLTNPHYFIFSDDPDWVFENLKINAPATYINHNGAENSHEDIRLMYLCKHHIIANSTFSWWGAWLNNKEEKIVIAPKNWFSDGVKHGRDSRDIIPAGWVQI